MLATPHGAVADEIAETMRTPGEAPEDGAFGLGMPRYSGTTIPSTYEHRAGLQDAPARFETFARMRRSSSAVMLGDRSLARTVRTASPMLLEGDATSKASAEGLAQQWGLGDFEGTGKCQQTLPQIAALARRAITDGSVFLAERWELEGGRWWMRRYELRHVSTFTHLYQDRRNGEFVGFRQQVDGAAAVVPLRQCLYIVDDAEEGGIFGVGLSRAAEPEWLDEQSALNKLRAAVHRFAHGTPYGGVKSREDWEALKSEALAAGKDPDRWFDAYRTAMVAQLRGYNANVNGYLTKEYWQEVGIIEANFDPAKLEAVITARQLAILRLYASGWMLAGGPGMGGTYNLVEVQALQLLDLADDSLALTYDAINKQTNDRWHAFNEPSIPADQRAALGYALPRPKRKEEIQELAMAHAIGLFTTGPEDERHFRASRELPEMPDEAEDMGPAARGGAIARRGQAPTPARPDFIQRARQRAAATPDIEEQDA
ncbi:MAG: hypothetical protein EKK55_16310 [Rhodocyclaceae bacterium]|nr:MAG: hypothetical protein EKK55_16310 [Rhodocyclaceae bacterium]